MRVGLFAIKSHELLGNPEEWMGGSDGGKYEMCERGVREKIIAKGWV
jgi:hypothetical protein